MPTPPLKPELMQEAVDAVQQHGSINAAARKLDIPWGTFQHRYSKAVAAGFHPGGSVAKPKREFEYAALPESELSFDELVEQRIKKYKKKQNYEEARKLIPVKVMVDGPIGIWHFGDPHIDDDGTDIEQLLEHADIVRNTEGLFGANVGDTTNNWIGRLARLWAEQSTTHTEAWILAEGFLRKVDWLYLIGGNHDAWSGSSDPIKWIQRGRSAPYMSSEVRLELRFPNGNTCRVNAHHDFNGHSQWNPAHGPMKASLMGVRDHLNIAGHKHISGYGYVKDPTSGAVCHSWLVAGYKIFDRYALEKGFRDQRVSPGVFTIIHPDRPNTHPDFITWSHSMEEGLEQLAWRRKKAR